MEKGWIDIKGLPVIKIKVKGSSPKEVTLDAIIDTGNDGYLLIPYDVAFPLGMEIVTIEKNNSNARRELFPSLVARGKVSIGNGAYTAALIDVVENSKVLIGTKLLKEMNKTLEIDFKNLTVEVRNTLKDDI